MKQIVIVGGGFAGIKVARGLRSVPGIKVTLISDQAEFRYSPALYRTATGRRRRESAIPVDYLLGPEDAFIQSKIKSIDRASRTLKTEDGKTIEYDYCVLALGVVTSYFGIPGLDTLSYSIKSAAEVERLKRHLHEQLTNEHATDKNYIIVGAGPTGVELASALGQYLRKIARRHQVRRDKVTIELIEALPRVLPTMSERASRLATKRLRKLGVKVMVGSKVKAETKNTLKVDNRSFPSHTVIWTAGVSNNPFFTANAKEFTLDKRQRVVVDPYLAVDDQVFVIGDNVSIEHGGLALTAVWQGKYIANLLKQIVTDGDFSPYSQGQPIYAVPLGEHRAIIEFSDITFDGWLGGIIRTIADLIGYSDIMGLKDAIRLWLSRDEFEETCPICRAPQVTQ